MRLAASVFVAAIILLSLGQVVQPARAETSGAKDTLKSCLSGNGKLPQLPVRLALVEPVFTETPYANFTSSFYAFYIKHHADPGAITSDFDMLKTKVVTGWPDNRYNPEPPLYNFLKSQLAAACGLVMGKNLFTITDIDVNNGALFSGSASRSPDIRSYDVVILGHEEYVTAAEYQQFRQFVASGGRIVEMSGNSFWAQVKYSPSTNIETFVVGHGFQFNGHLAWRSKVVPFDSSSSSWFGSVYDREEGNQIYGAFVDNSTLIGSILGRAFGNEVFKDYWYPHNEANYISNFTATQIVVRYHNHGGPLIHAVAAYVHRFRSGYVVCLCIYGENIIKADRAAQYFLLAATRIGLSPGQSLFLNGNPMSATSRGARGVLLNFTNFGLAPQSPAPVAFWRIVWDSHVINIAMTTGSDISLSPYQTLAIFILFNSTQSMFNRLLVSTGEIPSGTYPGEVLVYGINGFLGSLQITLTVDNNREM